MAKNDALVWDYFRSKGLTEAGTAGLMGNLYSESGLHSDRMQGDVPYSNKSVEYTKGVDNGTIKFDNGRIGYGIAQWTYYSRQRNLYNFMKDKGLSIGDLNGQLEFLYNELESSYRSVLNTLKSTTSVGEASTIVLTQFEKPEKQGSSVKTHRAELSANYFKKYSGRDIDPSELEFSDDESSSYTSGDSFSSVIPTFTGDYETLSNLDSQPYYAFVEISFGGHVLPQTPSDYLQNLTVQYIGGTGSTISLVLLDRYGDEIEEIILRALKEENYIIYGHRSGRQSKKVSFTLYNYTINFEPVGTLLTVTGITKEIESNAKEITTYAGDSPSSAVKAICDHLGYAYDSTTIHDTKPIVNGDGSTKSYKLIGEKPISYIRNYISPDAVRASDGKSGYQFYLDESTNPPIAHFHPIDIPSDVGKTYVYQRGLNNNVISFNITSEFYVSNTDLHGNTVEANTIDPTTGDEVNVIVDVNDRNDDVSGEYSHTVSNASTDSVTLPSMGYGEAVANLTYRMKVSQKVFSGSLTIVGDPTVELFSYIRIIVLTKNNYMHHSSGLYYVTSISHTISSGIMVTTLDVTKEEDIMGVELNSYKSVYK